MKPLEWFSKNRGDVVETIYKADEDLSVTQISRKSGVDAGNVSRITTKLSQLGIVTKNIHQEYYLTEEGLEVAKHLTKAAQAMPDTEGKPA